MTARFTRIAMVSRIIVVVLAVAATGQCFAQAGLPQAIHRAQFDSYLKKYLLLSEAQSQQIFALHDLYLEAWSEAFKISNREFSERWNAAFKSFDDFKGEDMAAAYEEAVELGEGIRAKRKTANGLFFDSVEVLLADEQLAGLQRVRYAHDRFSYRRGKATNLREFDMDVIELVEVMELSPDETAQIDLMIADSEPGFVAVLRDAVDVDTRRQGLIFQCIEMARQNTLHGADQARLEAAERISDKANRIAFASQRRLVEANRRGLRLFKSMLSSGNAIELQRIYDAEAYPEAVPDLLHIGGMFDDAIELARADANRVAALTEMKNSYELEHAAVTRKVIEALDMSERWKFEFAIKVDPNVPMDFEARRLAINEQLRRAEADIRETALKREALNLAQPARIRAMLLPEQVALLKPWKFENSPPVRPWARLANAETAESRRAEQDHQLELRRLRLAEKAKHQAATQPAATQPATAPASFDN